MISRDLLKWLLYIFIPSLIVLPEAIENEEGRELLRHEVEAMRVNATAIDVLTKIAKGMTKSRAIRVVIRSVSGTND